MSREQDEAGTMERLHTLIMQLLYNYFTIISQDRGTQLFYDVFLWW